MKRRTFLSTSLAIAGAGMLPRMSLAQGGPAEFELRAEKGQARLYGEAGPPSDLLLYEGQLPGPPIRVRRGQRVVVRFINDLDEPSSVHWHGIRIDNAMDGVSGLTQDPVPPGGEFVYDFVVPDAGTFWYHAHRETWRQVTLGLSGPLIVEEDDPPFDADHDITLVLNDWLLDENGVFDHESLGAPMHWSHDGRLGNWLTINGLNMPEIALHSGEWYRLRLINTSSSRVLDVDPGRFGGHIIARDGQPVGTLPKVGGPIRIAPAQRVDLVMRPASAGRIPFELVTGAAYRFADFVVSEGGPGKDSPAKDGPGMPVPNDLPEPDLSKAQEFDLVMEGGAMSRMQSLVFEGEVLSGRRFVETRQFWGFNGVAGMTQEPLFDAALGQTVLIRCDNRTVFPHAMHLHGYHFRLLALNGEPLADPQWRDTFLIDPGDVMSIAFVADNPGKWLIHCHMLEHAAAGMMSWFRVV